jgi:hypothetical protein
MPTTVRFRDHEEFQRAALHMAIAGSLAGLGAYAAGLTVPAFGGLTAAWAAAALVAAAAFGAARPSVRLRVVELGLVAGVSAAAGAVAAVAPSRIGVAALALAFGGLVARAGSRRRMALTAIGAGAAFLLCRHVFLNLVAAASDAAVPMWLTAGLTGGAFAFVGVLGLLPRHLEVVRDRVKEAHEAVKDRVSGEIRELADRGLAVWGKIAPSLESESPVRRALEDSLCRLFDVAGRWAEVEADGARAPVDGLVARMEAIATKMERTEDAITREQYREAHAALAEQLRYIKEIGTARERVIARMHHYLAAMERLRFAVINLRSHDASRVSTEVQPILDDLNDLGREIDFSSEALGEVEAAQPAK